MNDPLIKSYEVMFMQKRKQISGPSMILAIFEVQTGPLLAELRNRLTRIPRPGEFCLAPHSGTSRCNGGSGR
jgi:hypothetical protein